MDNSERNVNVAAKKLADELWGKIQEHARDALVNNGEAISSAVIALAVVVDSLMDAAPTEEARAEGERLFLQAARFRSEKSVH